MKTFKDGAELRLSLPWMPPVTYENPWDWASVLASHVDDAKLYDCFWYRQYEPVGDRIFFYLHTEKRKNELKKLLRHDKNWLAFVARFPEAQLEWADDVLETAE